MKANASVKTQKKKVTTPNVRSTGSSKVASPVLQLSWFLLPMLRVLALLVVVACIFLGNMMLIKHGAFKVSTEPRGLKIMGNQILREDEIRQVFTEDFGQSLRLVDVRKRMEQLHSLPWVKDAIVGRDWPNTILVKIHERVPIAFLHRSNGRKAGMIDTKGVILDFREIEGLSLPVLTGIDEEMSVEQRLERIQLFNRVVQEFDAKEPRSGQFVSEVDVSDKNNAVVFFKHKNQMVRLQMGDEFLRHRLEIFLSYIEDWQSEYGVVESVDLRFEKQVAIRPVKQGKMRG